MAELQAGHSPLLVGRVHMSSDDVTAVVRAEAPRDPGRLSAALSGLGLWEDHAVALEPRSVTQPPAGRGRGREPLPPAAGEGVGHVLVEVPPPPPGRGQVLLVDHGGALSWCLPERPSPSARSSAGDDAFRFRVPVAVPSDGELASRGVSGALARRVLRVLTFELLDPLAGKVGDFFVRRWEDQRRPHRLRSFAPDSYDDPSVPDLDGEVLRFLAGGPALLLVHGTNTLSHSGFSGLTKAVVEELHERYRGRVFAFDHPTLSVDPLVNAQKLRGLLPPDLALDVDLLCFSRGGLVARSLVELADEAQDGDPGQGLRVRQVVFVATPNRGTPLADPDHLGKLVDGLSNLLDLVPDNPVTDTLAGIVTVVKQLAVGAAKGLDGLVAMCPPRSPGRGDFLRDLNQARPIAAHYRAVATDYEPPPASAMARLARDKLIDGVFGWEPNDLIVPTASTYAWNGAAGFPISERLVLPAQRGVDHVSLWKAPEVLDVLSRWLSAGPSAVEAKPARRAAPLARHTDHLAELDQHFAAGHMDGVRAVVRDLPSSSRQALEQLVGVAAVGSFTSPARPSTERGSVFVLHGMMGSELFATDGPDHDHVWLNPLRLMGGELRRLRVAENGGAGPIVPGGLHRSYLPLVIALDQHWNVVPTAYDWRLPLSASAELFAAKIRKHFEDEPRPAHVVAHSTGGLVARMLLATRREVWDQMDSPTDRSLGGRLVMLGTPNLGSFAMAQVLSGQDGLVRWLASIDVGSSPDEIRQVLLSFPGAYELLTSSAASIENSGHALLYDAASWEEGLIDERLLGKAQETHERLAAEGVDPDRTYYVAGSGHETPAAVRVDGRGRFSFRMTREGDGRVPHTLGFPVDDAGTPIVAGKIWYTTAGHGDLPREKEVISGVVDLLRKGSTSLLRSRPPAGSRSRSVRGADWVAPDKVEPPRSVDLDAATEALRSPVVGRSERRQAARRAASAAVEEWVGRDPLAADAQSEMRLHVLHASLEHSSYPVLVGHYRGDPIRGAEGHLDYRLDGQLARRQLLDRYPREIGDVLRVTSAGNYPPGAIVVGLGGSGELTPSGLARATRDAALEHALGWLAQPEERVKVSDGAIGLSSVLLGSYGVAGMTLPAALAAIVEGVVLANGLLAERTGPQPVRIAVLEIVERYSEPAEDAARVLRHIDRLLPAALRATSELRPDEYMHLGEGGRPALPTAEYGAGMWHRLIVTTRSFDESTRVKELQFTSLGSRARADQLLQPVDTCIVGRMVKDSVTQTSVDPRVNSALFELLLPNEVKRELAAVENLQLVLDEGAADFPWEALTDRGALAGTGPFARKAGFLRQLSLPSLLRPDPASGSGGALVVGDPPGDLKLFRRLDGARHEAEQVAEMLASQMVVERQIFPFHDPPADSASRVLGALFASDYQVVHIAGHGYFKDDVAGTTFGGVVIGPGDFLTAGMLRNMRRPPDLVFLNCCHLASASGQVLDDPEDPDSPAFTRVRLNQMAASLSSELMTMGVKAVVAAGWSVADEPAAAFAQTFYELMLHGSLFGDAVRRARDAAFRADNGASNTWAAYQCYGDPAFQLTRGDHASPRLKGPVSADELVRRLEDISVAAGDSGRDDQEMRLTQVVELENNAPGAWRRQARVLGALGDAYRNLSSVADAIRCYREAIETGDAAMSVSVVEQLANLEQSLAIELREKPDTRVIALDPPRTEAALRKSAKKRLDTLDELGCSPGRYALRGGWHKREAALLSRERDRAKRTAALSASTEQYVAAWRLDRKPYGCLNALQLATLGAEIPIDLRTELVAWARDEFTAPPRSADFWDRVAAADRKLTLALIDNDLASEVDPIADAYLQVFEDRSRPGERDAVVSHLKHLTNLAAGETKDHLEDLRDRLDEWKPCS